MTVLRLRPSNIILFAHCRSVQGYGHKAEGIEAYVYPGSGATCDTRADSDSVIPNGIAIPVSPTSAAMAGLAT